MNRAPRIYQCNLRDFALDTPRVNWFAGMGLGKTSSGIDTFDTLWTFGEANHLLVIAPKLVAETSWPDEVKKWDQFRHLSITSAIGTPDERIAALRRRAQITTINYANLEWLVAVMGDEWYFDMVIADESTRLKGLRLSVLTSKTGKEFTRGQGSVRAKALSNVAHSKVRRWINMTGSPCPNGLQDLWGQQYFVDKGKALGTSFSAFEGRWFRSVPTPDGYSRIEPMPSADPQIKAAMKSTSMSVDARDYFDIKKPIDKLIKVPLPPKARRQYLELEKEAFTQIQNFEIEVFNSGGKVAKCHQIGSGAVYHDDQRNWVEVHNGKIEALKSVVEETGGAPLLVSYQWGHERDRILKAFPQARLLTKKTIPDFQAGLLPMAVCHPESAGHGLSLQDNCWICVYFSTYFNLEHDEQILERVGPTRQLQSGYKREVYRIRIVAEDTIEENVCLPRISKKLTVQEAFKQAMRRRA